MIQNKVWLEKIKNQLWVYLRIRINRVGKKSVRSCLITVDNHRLIKTST